MTLVRTLHVSYLQGLTCHLNNTCEGRKNMHGRFKRIISTGLIFTLLLSGCGAKGNDLVEESGEADEQTALNIIDDKYRTTYEIFVYSFYDSDGDGIGDLQGVIGKLDYIEDLGCNQIWLMPVSPSPTYHKYDITDYTDIDSQYGTLEDFDELIKECHERGIRVIIDLVLNHTSSQHPWFLEAKEYLKDHSDIDYEDSKLQEECPYLYYYNFSKEEQTGYEKLNGTEWYYEARFWSEMPDLNLDNERVRKDISDITQFWTDRGVDGFRLDAVTYYYTGDDEKNIEFMTWLNETVKSQNEDAYIVAEAWTASATYSQYYQSGIDSFFDFDFSGSEGMIASVARSKKSPQMYANALKAEDELFSKYSDTYVNAPFYTNHDMARSAGYFVGKGSENMVKMAGALNLLMSGNAFIYYGEELGMKGSGKDENKRAPMQWGGDDSGSGNGDTNGQAAEATGMCDGPEGMEDFEMIYPALDVQESDPYSIYNYYKAAIRLRNTYPVIARGSVEPVEELSDDRLGAFVKYINSKDAPTSADYYLNGEGNEDETYGPNALLILINNSDEVKKIDLSKWEGAGDNPELDYQLVVSEEEVTLDGMNLSIPSYGIAVLR